VGWIYGHLNIWSYSERAEKKFGRAESRKARAAAAAAAAAV
jgi:hypothetical protein